MLTLIGIMLCRKYKGKHKHNKRFQLKEASSKDQSAYGLKFSCSNKPFTLFGFQIFCLRIYQKPVVCTKVDILSLFLLR